MAEPSIRTMPVIRCVQQPTGTIVVHLPGNRSVEVIDEEHARRLVWREACGSAIRWEAGPVAPLSESERRALWGDR